MPNTPSQEEIARAAKLQGGDAQPRPLLNQDGFEAADSTPIQSEGESDSVKRAREYLLQDGATWSVDILAPLLAAYAQSELQREADCAEICQFYRGECASRMTVDDEKAGRHRLNDEFGHEWFRDCVAKNIRPPAPTAAQGSPEIGKLGDPENV